MLITFEGLDFSGKTTQASMLVAKLRGFLRARTGEAPPVHLIREPGGTGISERIREILLDRKTLEMTDAAELFLFSASRTQLVHEVVRPALARGELVVCDRYDDSTMAYQGYGRGINTETVRSINRLATEALAPALTLLIDIDVDEIERRNVRAGVAFDRMESSGREFYERVRAGYAAIARAEPDRVVTINGMRPVQEVERDVWHAVERIITMEKQPVGT